MSFTLYRPHTAAEAFQLLRQPDSAPLAGGTVVMVDYNRGKPVAEHLISLEGIPGWDAIKETPEALLLGPLVTFDQIEGSEPCHRAAYALWQAAASVGGPQVRNRATLGGNLAAASPAADSAAPLLVLEASLVISSTEGSRVVPLSAFFVGPGKTVLQPGELITAIRIPKAGLASRFRKVGKRNALAVSCAGMAAAAMVSPSGELTDIRIAAGSVAPCPFFCHYTSAMLNSAPLTEERIAMAGELLQTEISPIGDRWATEEYRRTLCGNLLPALLAELKEGAAL